MAEITAPESDKFTAPLVLVHGLWGQPADWRRFAGYLAHRGWRCIAVERPAELTRLDAITAALERDIAALETPPVLIGHDLGANLVLHCAAHARAVVALAPLAGAPVALQRPGSWLERWRGGRVRPPRRIARGYPDASRTEPLSLVQEVAAGPPVSAPADAVPRAVFAMAADDVVPAAATQAFASAVRAATQEIAGAGHAVLADPQWERCVAAVHRWIVRELGVDLLALYDEAWEGREPE